jgi:hypothetical protein
MLNLLQGQYGSRDKYDEQQMLQILGINIPADFKNDNVVLVSFYQVSPWQYMIRQSEIRSSTGIYSDIPSQK